MGKPIKSCSNKGFQLTFENGCTVSVQWGPGNYTDSCNRHAGYGDAMKHEEWDATSAECWAWGPDRKEIFGGPAGWLDTDDIADYIMRVKLHKVGE